MNKVNKKSKLEPRKKLIQSFVIEMPCPKNDCEGNLIYSFKNSCNKNEPYVHVCNLCPSHKNFKVKYPFLEFSEQYKIKNAMQ